jgi:YVTN family beta-propeller protein
MPAGSAAPRGRVVVASSTGRSLTIVEALTNRVTATIPVPAPLRKVTVAPDRRTAWAFGGDPGAIDVSLVDLGSSQITTKRMTDVPRDIAFSSDGRRAFVSLDKSNSVAFLDWLTLSSLGQVVLGRQSAGMQMRRHLGAIATLRTLLGDVVYVAGRNSGVVWALNADTGAVLEEIAVGGGPFQLLADQSGTQVHCLLDTLNQLVTINARSQQIIARISLPGPATDAAVSANGHVFIASEANRAVWVIDPNSSSGVRTIPFAATPTGLALSAGGERLYVATSANSSLDIVDTSSLRLIDRIPVGVDPVGVTFVDQTVSNEIASFLAANGTPSVPAAPLPSPSPAVTVTPTALPAGTVLETFVPGANFPVTLAFAPDGRMFFSELRTGRIRVVENGVLLRDPFFTFLVASQPEAGLIGLILDPDFAYNHYVYANYTTDLGGGVAGPNRVVRLTDRNSRGSELQTIIAELPSGPIHNAGRLRFGPDGKLYVSLGENNIISRAQDLSSPSGKILRFNPDGSIPPDNPFVKHPGAYPAIWAYGLRNPPGLDFHPVTGAPFVTENGPGDNDELDLIVRGGNYGWPPTGYKDTPGVIDPLAVFNPTIGPVGLAFYRGSQISEWSNDLFYCNYHAGQLRRVRLAPESFDRIVYDETVVNGGELDVTTGPDGALYFSDLTTIYRIRNAAASALAVVADAEPSAATPTPVLPAGTRREDRDVDIDLNEWSITVSRTTIPAGAARFVVANLGATTHALQIVGNGVRYRTKDLAPQDTALLELQLPPGDYQLSCPIGDHAQMGMVASLHVVGS